MSSGITIDRPPKTTEDGNEVVRAEPIRSKSPPQDTNRDSISNGPKAISPGTLRRLGGAANHKNALSLERSTSQKIDVMLKEEKKKLEEYQLEPKVLILGSSDSGKSTMLKQFRILHGESFSEDEKNMAKYSIYKNLLVAVITLLALAEDSSEHEESEHSSPQTHLTPQSASKILPSDSTSSAVIESFVAFQLGSGLSDANIISESMTVLTSRLISKYQAIMVYGEKSLRTTITSIPNELRPLIQSAFNEPAVQTALQSGYDHHKLPDTTSYFVEPKKLACLLEEKYMPSNDDILYLRTITHGINTLSIIPKGNTSNTKRIHLFDVSGLKGHRKSWIPYFDDCNSIMFIVALSSFDQTLLEDATVNRMLDALVLFDQTSGNKMLSKCDFILMLNKKDLFQEKSLKVKLSTHFPDYHGPNHNANEYAVYIKQKFENAFKSDRKLTVHFTCATDTKAIAVVITNVLNSMVSNNLRDVGFLA